MKKILFLLIIIFFIGCAAQMAYQNTYNRCMQVCEEEGLARFDCHVTCEKLALQARSQTAWEENERQKRFHEGQEVTPISPPVVIVK